jgi:hypothetical protein
MIAEDILESMKKRGKQLFENTLVLAAIYLDVFNTDKLSDE